MPTKLAEEAGGVHAILIDGYNFDPAIRYLAEL